MCSKAKQKQAKNAFFVFLCPLHQSILLSQGPIQIFMKKYWELAELENEFFLSRPFWIFFASSQWKKAARSYEVSFFSALDGFSRILEKKLFELLCTRLYFGTRLLTFSDFIFPNLKLNNQYYHYVSLFSTSFFIGIQYF